MPTIDEPLLATALSEIVARDPGFLERCPVGVARPPVTDAALDEGLAWFADRGLRISPDPAALPLVARMITDSIADASGAARGRIALSAGPGPDTDLAAALAGRYALKEVGGVRYLARGEGARWLVVVNAVGIPLALWSRLLCDPDHDYRVLVVESGACDLIAGGMDRPSDIAIDADRIRQVLDAEGVDVVHVVGWCSGGQVAVEVAAREPDRVKSLVLASCSFRGAAGVEPRPTQFERDVEGIVETVTQSASAAPFLSRLLTGATKATPPPADAVSLFRLAAKAHGAAVLAPLADGDRLVAYCARLRADAAHATSDALARVSAPILMIAGEYDQIIDNDFTHAVLAGSARSLAKATVSAAGHYVHDLQYPYFRMILDAFTTTGAPPPATARVR